MRADNNISLRGHCFQHNRIILQVDSGYETNTSRTNIVQIIVEPVKI